MAAITFEVLQDYESQESLQASTVMNALFYSYKVTVIKNNWRATVLAVFQIHKVLKQIRILRSIS
jgi:hypothetical protein